MLKKLFHNEVISYLIFGILTTLVNLLVFEACFKFGLQVLVANIIAWLISVLFAFVTNARYVFRSTYKAWTVFLRELWRFMASRLFTLAVETLILYFCLTLWQWPSLPVKLFAQVFVIVLNYVLSKCFIFIHK